MSDNNEFPIKIRADLEGDGLKKTSAQLEDVAKEAKAANQEFSKSASGGAGEAGKAIAAVGEKAEGAAEKTHGLHAIIRTLGSQFPGLERFGRFLESGFTAALGVVALAAAAFKASLDDLVSSLSDLSTGAGAASDVLDKNREHADEAAISFNLWEHSLRQAADATAVLTQKTEELLTRQRAAIQTENDMAQAQKEFEEARLDLAVKLGQVTPEQAIKIRLEIDEAAFKRQAELKIKEIEAEINARTRQQSQSTANDSALGGQVNQTRAAAEKAAAAKQANDSKLEQDKKNLEATQAAAEKNQTWLDDHAGDWMSPVLSPERVEMEARQKSVDAMQTQMTNLRRSIKQEESKAVPLGTAAETTKADADAARKAYETAQKDVEEQRKKVESLTADLAVEKAKAAALESIHNKTAETRATGQTMDAQDQAFKAAETLDHQLHQSGGSAADWDRLANLIRGLHQAVASGQAVDRTRAEQIRILEQDVANLQRYNGNGGQTR